MGISKELFPACTYKEGHKMCIGRSKGVKCICRCHRMIRCNGCGLSSKRTTLPKGWQQFGGTSKRKLASWCPKCVAAKEEEVDEHTTLALRARYLPEV